MLPRRAFEDGMIEAVGYRLPLAAGWEPPDAPSRLWLFHLHYFDWLRQRELSTNRGLEHIHSWISDHRDGTGWHPYPCSRRIVNWIGFLLERGVMDERIHRSLVVQLHHLWHGVEWDLMSNHLIANLKAILFGVRFFRGPFAWAMTAKTGEILREQLARQILSDGGYEERAPMYQAQVLEDLLDLISFLDPFDPLVFTIRDAAERLLTHLASILHPDGRLPLLGDSADGMVPSPGELIEHAAALGLRPSSKAEAELVSLSESGYLRARRGRWCLVARTGAIGPDHQMGHAHADSCTFELSLGGRSVVADTGCGHYDRGAERDLMRSTAAHSTLEIDGLSSSEVWASHRVGRRAKPLQPEVQEMGDLVTATCGHTGYRHLMGGPVHLRTFSLSSRRLRIEDRVEGWGSHRLCWRLHLAPGLKVSPISQDRVEVELEGGEKLLVRSSVTLPIEIKESPFFPRFGASERRPCLEVSITTELPVRGEMQLEVLS
jgi:uncharacterized heparinase superfamily protein